MENEKNSKWQRGKHNNKRQGLSKRSLAFGHSVPFSSTLEASRSPPSLVVVVVVVVIAIVVEVLVVVVIAAAVVLIVLGVVIVVSSSCRRYYHNEINIQNND